MVTFSTTTTNPSIQQQQQQQQQQQVTTTNGGATVNVSGAQTSMIKSLLANKVTGNESNANQTAAPSSLSTNTTPPTTTTTTTCLIAPNVNVHQVYLYTKLTEFIHFVFWSHSRNCVTWNEMRYAIILWFH